MASEKTKDSMVFILDELIRRLKDLLFFELASNKVPIRKYRGFNNDLFQFKQLLELNAKDKAVLKTLITENKKELLESELLRIKLYDDAVFEEVTVDEIVRRIDLLRQVIEKAEDAVTAII